VLHIVEDAAKKKSIVIKGHISNGWWYHFVNDAQSISSKGRSIFSSSSRDDIPGKCLVELLKEALMKHDLMDTPAQIYNCNKFGMPLGAQNAQKVAQKGKKVRQQSSGSKLKDPFLLVRVPLAKPYHPW